MVKNCDVFFNKLKIAVVGKLLWHTSQKLLKILRFKSLFVYLFIYILFDADAVKGILKVLNDLSLNVMKKSMKKIKAGKEVAAIDDISS